MLHGQAVENTTYILHYELHEHSDGGTAVCDCRRAVSTVSGVREHRMSHHSSARIQRIKKDTISGPMLSDAPPIGGQMCAIVFSDDKRPPRVPKSSKKCKIDTGLGNDEGGRRSR